MYLIFSMNFCISYKQKMRNFRNVYWGYFSYSIFAADLLFIITPLRKSTLQALLCNWPHMKAVPPVFFASEKYLDTYFQYKTMPSVISLWNFPHLCHLEEFIIVFHPPFSKTMVFMLQKGISSTYSFPYCCLMQNIN